MAHYEHDEYSTALMMNRRAIRQGRKLPVTSWRVVENYDDAGLYYFSTRQWRMAARYQSIAVLLSCGTGYPAGWHAEYTKRLSWAFKKYRPKAKFAKIEADPTRLLKDPALKLRRNYDIWRKFFSPSAERDALRHCK